MTSVTEEERRYFDQMPAMFPVYVQLKERLEQRYENIRVKVTKTQISFSNRYIFTVVSLPWRRHKGWPEKYLLVSFGLDYKRIRRELFRQWRRAAGAGHTMCWWRAKTGSMRN